MLQTPLKPKTGPKPLPEAERETRFQASGVKCLDAWVNANTVYDFQCLTCNHIWPEIGQMITNRGKKCPKCHPRRKRGGKSLSAEEVSARLLESNLECENWRGSRKKNRIRCRTCNHRWSEFGLAVLNQGNQCPRCVPRRLNSSSLKSLLALSLG